MEPSTRAARAALHLTVGLYIATSVLAALALGLWMALDAARGMGSTSVLGDVIGAAFGGLTVAAVTFAFGEDAVGEFVRTVTGLRPRDAYHVWARNRT